MNQKEFFESLPETVVVALDQLQINGWTFNQNGSYLDFFPPDYESVLLKNRIQFNNVSKHYHIWSKLQTFDMKKREFIYDWCENGFYSFKSLSQKSVEEILSLFKNNFL